MFVATFTFVGEQTTSMNQKANASWVFVSILSAITFLILAFSQQSCGRETFAMTPQERDRHYREKYSATDKNTASWVHLWDQKSWLVGLPKDATETPDMKLWRSVVIDGLSQFYAPQILPSEFAQFRDLLSSTLAVTFSHSPNKGLINVGLEPADATEWFGKIELPAAAPLWEPILNIALPISPLPNDILERLAISQFQALESLEKFEWVEPNLGSETQQNDGQNPTDRCVFEDDAQSWRSLEWYCDGNGDAFENPAENRLRRVLSLIKWPEAQDALAEMRKEDPNRGNYAIPIAVIDTGVDYAHPRLEPRMYKNSGEIPGNGLDDDNNGFIDDYYGFDATIGPGKIDPTYQPPGPADAPGVGQPCDPRTARCGHGTHVAGTITANTMSSLPDIGSCSVSRSASTAPDNRYNSCTALGVCEQCRIFSIRAAERCLEPEYSKTGVCKRPTAEAPPRDQFYGNGKIFDWDQTVGLNYLLNFTNPDSKGLAVFIVNLSLGKYLYNRTMYSALAKLEAQGILVVAAAGNDNTETPMFPAAYPSTLAVCATSEDGSLTSTSGKRGAFAKADFSNFGDWVDICAPGRDIQSTFPGGQYRAQDGTSMASPIVAGAAGYLWSILKDDGVTNRDIRNRLVRYANAAIYQEPLNQFYGDLIGGVPNYLLGTGMLDVHAALVTESGGAQASPVATFKNTGASSQLKSGCIVSAVGAATGSRQWSFSEALTTMPLMAIQFIIAMLCVRPFGRRKIKKPGS